jgi:cobalt-zinc-cadmium efflux system protein
VIIRYTSWAWVDSAIAVLIGLWVLPRTWTLLKESLNVLLEGVPEGLNLLEIKKTIEEINCVVSVHELHVWAITSGKASLTAHVVTELAIPGQQILLKKIRETIAEQFDIHHCTVQLESEPCDDAGEHSYSPRISQSGGENEGHSCEGVFRLALR